MEIRWYGLAAGLSPHLSTLAAGLRVGDAALSIASFSVPAAAPMRALAASRPNILWIEDKSHAVDAGHMDRVADEVSALGLLPLFDGPMPVAATAAVLEAAS